MDEFNGIFIVLVVCIIGAFTFSGVFVILSEAERIATSAENNNTEIETATNAAIEAEGNEETTDESCDESNKDDTITFLICLVLILAVTGSSSSGGRW